LNKCRPISEDQQKHFKTEFDNTSLFLVEIASRIAYVHTFGNAPNPTYLHHIAEEREYGFPYRDQIMKQDLTDDQIEEDILTIRRELYPKPFIIISHFATYDHGKRYELIKLLETICAKYDIPFLNQSDIVAKYGTDILQKEPILAHYTDVGKTYVGKILFEKIKQCNFTPWIEEYHKEQMPKS